MNKSVLLSIVFIGLWVSLALNVNAQGVGINSTNAPPDSSALLDLSSTTKGILITRMTTAQRDAIGSPAIGLFIFNTECQNFNVFTSAGWQPVNNGINAPVALSASASPNPVCEGSALTLTATTTGATNWRWSGPNGFTSTLQNPTLSNITTAGAGVYTLVAGNTCGTSAPVNTAAVTITALPGSVSASASPNPICEGITLTLAGSATGATSWSWTGPNSFSSSLQNPIISNITTAAAGVYTLAASNACGSAPAVNTATVTINSNPSAPVATAATGISKNQFTANWNVIATATSYALDVSSDISFSTGFILNNQNVGNVLTYNVTGLIPGTTYYYRIRAINSCTSGHSNSMTATTPNLAAGIVAYWKMDESSGNAADATGNGYNGVNTSVSYSSGKINNAGVFNGTGSVLKTTAPDINSNTFSASVWVNTTNYSNHNNIFRQENSGGSFIIRVERSIGSVRMYSNAVIDLFSNTVIPLNQWVFVVVTGDASGTKIYINGVLDASNSQTNTVHTNNVWIGLGDGGEYFTGQMDEAGLWSRTLSATEVSALYNGGNGLQYPF